MMSLQICGRPLLTVAGAFDDGLTDLFPWAHVNYWRLRCGLCGQAIDPLLQ